MTGIVADGTIANGPYGIRFCLTRQDHRGGSLTQIQTDALHIERTARLCGEGFQRLEA